MPKNKSIDLNNHLFEQLERLNDEDLTDEQLEKEIERSKAMTSIARVIIDNGRLALDAQEMKAKYNYEDAIEIPKMLEG